MMWTYLTPGDLVWSRFYFPYEEIRLRIATPEELAELNTWVRAAIMRTW